MNAHIKLYLFWMFTLLYLSLIRNICIKHIIKTKWSRKKRLNIAGNDFKLDHLEYIWTPLNCTKKIAISQIFSYNVNLVYLYTTYHLSLHYCIRFFHCLSEIETPWSTEPDQIFFCHLTIDIGDMFILIWQHYLVKKNSSHPHRTSVYPDLWDGPF